MLERTVAGLESGNFHRVLPRPTRPPPCACLRRPRASFSQCHGVSAEEQVPGQASRPNDERFLQRTTPDEPSILLDFLYPKRTLALLRQERPILLSSRGRVGRSSVARGGRHVSSTANRRSSNGAVHRAVVEETNEQPPQPSPQPSTGQPHWSSTKVSPRDTYAASQGYGTDGTADDAALNAELDVSRGSASNHSRSHLSLAELLADEQGEHYLDVWDQYCRLEPTEREALRPRVISYLAKSRSVVETGRAMSLVRQVPIDQWDNQFVSAAVLVFLRSGHQDRAVETFKFALKEKSLVGGFEYILLDAVNKQQWPELLQVWTAYCREITQKSPPVEPDKKLLEPLTSLPSLGALYFSFERYLAQDDMKAERWMDADKISKMALRIFRREFAVEALRQPCPPKQASIILGFWRDHSLYERYLWRMFDRWYTKRISASTARMLPDIYQKYKELPGAKPSLDVMRGIFKVHYPTGVAALEQLYQDWVRCWGELNHWGFEKFLKFYAYRGDVDKVRELWARYVQNFPSRLKTPRGFRSTLNVYAQIGDVVGAEQEFDRMISQYHVEPDLDSWNTLLKCYMRAGDYGKALSCFEEIRTNLEPDSYTYAHVMAMCAKKGDLDTVVDFFNEAQQNRVAITKEIGLALVVAYCQNDLLIEAENICIELANRRITSTAIWNQLLHHNGMEGRLNKCYELLNLMKGYHLEWDQETIGSLLEALVRVNQISPAFQVIRDSLRNNLHVLRPDHFAIVMLGAARTGDRPTGEALMSLMEKSSIPIPFNMQVAYAQAALEQAPNAARTQTMSKKIVSSLRSLLRSQGGEGGDIRRLKQETQAMGRAVKLLVQFRDFASVEELMNLYSDLYPQSKQGELMPQDVLTSLMLAYHLDENYQRVLDLWHEAWPKILKRSSKINGEGIYPAHKYDVTRLIFRLSETYRAIGDGDGLLDTIEQVINAGFEFTSNTWERVICALADLGQWERAMYFCETMLMPAWQGWTPKKEPLEKRRENMNSRVLKPSQSAVLSLQKEWLETRRLAAWSADVTRKLADMKQRYPMLHHAFSTSDYVDAPGPWIFSGDIDLAKAISQLLTPLSIQELRAMEKVLEKQLKRQKALGISPFRLFGADGTSTQALQRQELKQLKAALRETLSDKSKISSPAEMDAGDQKPQNVLGTRL